ncbi:uncharacterized protein LOC113238093, partial [Hyposmocoma kahamanoa]|uniref:uncharacterized protein LOC113238093 n=1 Tax=Hyposmocoma kahamanoa TaxID=1477025 RepID=UPI000E6D8E81
MSHSAKASTTLKGKKLDLVQEEKTTELIPNKKNMLAASASPQTQQARNKRSVVSPDRELVPSKKNKKKKSKNTLGSPPDDGPIIASLTEEYMKEMQNQLLEKQTVMNKDSKANFTNIIYKHRVTSKVTAPMNSLADFQITPTLKQKASLKASIDKYPVLKNQELVNKFMAVPMTNNQKGRIRQVLREIFKGTSETLLPDVINNRIQAILKSSPNLTDIDLRKIRILYNMLKKSTENKDYTLEMEIDSNENEKKPKKRKKGAKKVNDDIKKDSPIGSKRYVLFIGNLPLAVTKEQILDHFWDLRDSVKDVRLPKRDSSKKTAIAYIELMNEPSYEVISCMCIVYHVIRDINRVIF